jgi:hypothetical protein
MNSLFPHVLFFLRQFFVLQDIVRFRMAIVVMLLLMVFEIVDDLNSIPVLLNTEYQLVKLVVLLIQLILV